MSDRLRVVYILSVQNSGSTLLDAVLGAAPGVRSLGEAAGFHRYADSGPCDCGRPAATCGPCASVVETIERGGGLDRYRAVARLPMRGRCLHWAFVPTRKRRAYARAADAMFEAVAANTRATVLVDSSKNVGRAAALLADSRHDVRILHLVRDPRGYLQSRQRRADAVGREPAAVTFLKWLGKNALISALVGPRARGRMMRCQYEDLLAEPGPTIAAVAGFAGFDSTGLAEAATGAGAGAGVERLHLYEPARRLDYRRVTLDAARLEGQRVDGRAGARFWWAGGFTSALWGYDRRQSYLRAVTERGRA
jgi:hypothetical protein